LIAASGFAAMLTACGGGGGGGGGHAAVHADTAVIGAGASAPIASGRIAFVSDDGRLWTVAADGSDARMIFQGAPNFPAWSPDGGRIAWECHNGGGGGSELCVAASDGHALRRWPATAATIDLLRPAWSPDGRRIVLDGGDIARDGTVAQPVDVDMDTCAGCPGNGLRWFAPDGRRWFMPTSCDADWPRFSPDGTRLALVLNCRRSQHLVTMRRDGSHLHTIARRHPTDISVGCPEAQTCAPPDTGAGTFDHVSWSPDGRSVVFASGDRHGWDIHTARWDGQHNHRLTTDRHSYYPSFSPDGKMIVYQSWSGYSWDIWVMRRDGHDRHPITTAFTDETVGHDRHPITTALTDETKPAWCCSAPN
jgi:Tol biopolymer transport system component